MLEGLETILGVQQVQRALAILTFTKHGISDSEMIDLLAFDVNFHSSTTYGNKFWLKSWFFVSILLLFLVSWAPACLAWSRLNKHLAPFLHWSLTGHRLGVQWKDDMLRKAVSERYAEHKCWAHQMLFDYYNVSNIWIIGLFYKKNLT